MHGDDNLVPVDAPENKGHSSGGFVDDSHQMIQHQLINLKQNVDVLLEHLSQCNCPHVQEEEVKKKIILAADYLDSARDYVFSSHGDGETDEHDSPDEHDDGGGFMVTVEKRLTQ